MGTGARAFNATTMLPPNPIVTGSVIAEQAPVKSPLFPALSSRLEKSTTLHSAAGVISHHDTPRDIQGQRSCITKSSVSPNPRAGMLLPKEGSSDRSQRFNHSVHGDCRDIRACSHLSQHQTMYWRQVQRTRAPSSPKYPVTRRFEATTVRRPQVGQRHTPIKAYSNTYIL